MIRFQLQYSRDENPLKIIPSLIYSNLMAIKIELT